MLLQILYIVNNLNIDVIQNFSTVCQDLLIFRYVYMSWHKYGSFMDPFGIRVRRSTGIPGPVHLSLQKFRLNFGDPIICRVVYSSRTVGFHPLNEQVSLILLFKITVYNPLTVLRTRLECHKCVVPYIYILIISFNDCLFFRHRYFGGCYYL